MFNPNLSVKHSLFCILLIMSLRASSFTILLKPISATITIAVQDTSGKPIPKATFTNKTKNYALLFDEGGKLDIRPQQLDAADQIMISCIGYQNRFFSGQDILSGKRLIITLNADPVSLKEVRISAVPENLQFKNIKPLPFPLLYQACTTDGEFAYTVGGQSGMAICTQALKYDPRTNNWSVLAHGLQPAVQASACYVPSTGKIYVIGGVTSLVNLAYTDAVESIDVKTGEVKVLPVKNPAPKGYAGSAVWNDKIYIFGGGEDLNRSATGKFDDSFYEFDPVEMKFTRLPDLPEKKQTSGAIIDGILYCIGGYNSREYNSGKNLYAYNIAGRQWKLIGKLPKEVSANGIAAYGQLIFVTGGYNNQNYTGLFNTQTQVFRTIKSNIIDRKHSGAVTIANYLMVIGGSNSLSEFGIKSVQVADLSTVTAKEQ